MNKRLTKLVEDWIASGSPQQEAFNWTSSRDNWIKYFPEESRFISSLPDEIDREKVRSVCDSKKSSIREKFLTAMIWGYGDRGYGPYRVSKMLTEEFADQILARVYSIAQNRKPKVAYDYLKENKIKNLGPSYGSKFITFSTPRDVSAPIYDSFIALWIAQNAKNELPSFSSAVLKWNTQTYSEYCDWIEDHSKRFECFSDDIELVLFRDAEQLYSRKSNWSGK